MTRIRWVVLAVGVFAIALGVVFVASLSKGEVSAHGNLLGKRAPAVRLTNLVDGSPVSTTPATGHVVVINFWNSWCIPCRQEERALSQFYAEHKNDTDFTMVGILRSDSEKAARLYASENKMHWTLASDPKGDAAVAFGTTGQPETYVIGPDGIVAATLYGPASVDDLDKMLATARGA